MRILLVTEDLPTATPGGAGLHAAVLGNALLDEGHEVHLLGHSHLPAVPLAPTHWAGFRGPVHTGIDFRGARWQEVRIGAFVPFARPHMARRIWQAILRLTGTGAWDVVHYHGHNPLLGLQIPSHWNFVQTLHDQGAECITRTRFRHGVPCRETRPEACAGCATTAPNALQRWMSARAVTSLRRGSIKAYQRHGAIFVSDFIRQRYEAQLGQRIPGAVTVHNFCDTGRLAQAAQRPAAPWDDGGRLRVFGVGRLDEAKGFAAWLSALTDEQLQKMDVVIAGTGPDQHVIQQRHAVRGVRFIGWRTPEEVLAWTRAADACVVPSLCEEACATTVLEALALGSTVFALSRGGTPELSRYAHPGQLHLFDDLHALNAALLDTRRMPSRAPATNLSASVTARLPELMAVYTARHRGTAPAQEGTAP